MKKFSAFIQLSVLILCVYLIYIISVAIFNGVVYFNSPHLMHTQFWICTWFIAVFLIQLVIARKDWWNYIKKNTFFLIISIPYLNIIDFMNWDNNFTTYEIGILRFIPLIRGGFALAYVVGWLSTNKISSIFVSYIIFLFSWIYFGSLIFFEMERGVNTMVTTYWDAAWWAFMDATTVGSNIYAVTPLGKALSVLLAALGMMMFPIFTVYITNLVQIKSKKEKEEENITPSTKKNG